MVYVLRLKVWDIIDSDVAINYIMLYLMQDYAINRERSALLGSSVAETHNSF